MIETFSISLGYHDNNLLKDISFRIDEGKFVSIIGKNGTGKTTLLHSLAGFIPARKGQINILGRPIQQWPKRELAQTLGFFGHQPMYVEGLCVKDFVSMSLDSRNSNRFMTMEQIFEELAITHLQERLLASLSSGEFQKVNLASTIYQNPRILLLDEPLCHLDPNFQVHVKKFLQRIHRNHHISILAVLHNVNDAIELSDKILALSGKTLAFFGFPEQLDAAILQKVYDNEFEEKRVVVPK